MTTNQTRNQSKSRDHHASERLPRGERPAHEGSRSADEIRETVKEAVGKGVAAVAGAVEGVDETMTETHLGETAEHAVRQVGETATKVVRAARETTTDLKQAFRGEGGSPSEDIDLETERDDPTFSASRGLVRSKPADLGLGTYDLGESDAAETEANSSGQALESSSYNDEDDEGRSQGI